MFESSVNHKKIMKSTKRDYVDIFLFFKKKKLFQASSYLWFHICEENYNESARCNVFQLYLPRSVGGTKS